MSQIDGQSAVMYRPGKILKSGTWSDPEFPNREATNRSTAIDMTAAGPAWTEQAPMKYRRSYHTLTVLPDGKVLATGGQNGTDGVDETTGVLPAEMWDPDTNTWATMASSRRPRLYHSSAVLMPDARVLLAGGGAYGNAKNERSGELFSPPYLFKGPRPQVTAAPDQVHYGQSFTVDTPDASRITKVSFVRMGSVTHNVDMDQRFMNLSMTTGSGAVTITGPANANLAPPGYYMVFLLDDQGVPSMGQIVQLEPSGDTQPPTAPSGLAATAQPGGANLSWTASSDNKAVSEYRVFRSTTVRLHAQRRQPDRPGEDRHDVRRSRRRHRDAPLQGARGGQGREPEPRLQPGVGVHHRRHHGADRLDHGAGRGQRLRHHWGDRDGGRQRRRSRAFSSASTARTSAAPTPRARSRCRGTPRRHPTASTP